MYCEHAVLQLVTGTGVLEAETARFGQLVADPS
jgi:hypothetical protein